jgi:hypothetical protein
MHSRLRRAVSGHLLPNNERGRVRAKVSARVRNAPLATPPLDRRHGHRRAQGQHQDPRLLEGTPLAVAPHLPPMVRPGDDRESGQVATEANNHVTISWLEIVLEITASTCMLEGAAEAALHHDAPLPRLP